MRNMKANSSGMEKVSGPKSLPDEDFGEKLAERDRSPVEVSFDYLSEKIDTLQNLLRQLDTRIQPVSCDRPVVQGEALKRLSSGNSAVVRSLEHHTEHLETLCAEVRVMLEGLEV